MFNQIKTKVSKIGKPEDYFNLPVLNRYSKDKFKEKIIGTVTNVIKADEYYELTITLWLDKIELKKEILVDTGKVCSLAIS